ncbi:MAG: hypothetical protein RIR26_1298 [Pseudomonadota bacterium]
MQMTMSELNTKIETDKFPMEVFSITPFQLHQYKDGELVAEVNATEARLVTTGKLTAQGNVQIRVVDSQAEPAYRFSTVRSEKLVALSPRSNGLPFDIWGNESRFERMELPGDAEIEMRGHRLLGRSFFVDASNMTLVTKEPVRLIAQGRTLEAKGLESDLRTRDFKFIGPVRGTEIPPAKTQKSRPSRASENKRRRASGRAQQ